MENPDNTKPRSSSVRQPVLLGLFAGTAVGAGYLLAGVPNVELMTLIASLAGAALGWPSGALVGALAATIYSLGSPYGPPVPVLLIAQAVGLALAGVLGHVAARPIGRALAAGRRRYAILMAGILGCVATLCFDVLTNLAGLVAFDLAPAVVVVGAVPFVLIHVGANALIFGTLAPILLPRLAGLSRAPLTGGSGGGVAVLILAATIFLAGNVSAQTDPDRSESSGARTTPDSLATETVRPEAAPPDTGPYRAFGWRRPLWTPFSPTGLGWADWYSSWLPVTDGGLGASSVLLNEAGTSRVPLITRDAVPLGTGHVLTDDPSFIPTQGLVLRDAGHGADGWGGTGGHLETTTADPQPDRASSQYRGIKGKHETYFRAIHVLTPDAAWRAGFEFEESIDAEGYNFTTLPDDLWVAGEGVEFPGHGKVRQSRARLMRRFAEDDQLTLEYGYNRKTKDSLPVLGAEHLELWDDSIAATTLARVGSWRTRTVLFWRNRDISFGDRGPLDTEGVDRRLIETGREGLTIEMTRDASGQVPLTGLRFRAAGWRVYDSGTSSDWAAGALGDGSGKGQEGLAVFRTGVRTASSRLVADLGGQWDNRSGLGPEVGMTLEHDVVDPRWSLKVHYGGRAPRSDEYLTPLQHFVDGRGLALLPNPDLDREKTLRVGGLVNFRLVGFDLALDGSWRRLAEGIAWEASAPGSDTGTWANGLEMSAAQVTGRLFREGRFLGWGRLMLEGTWRSIDETEGRASMLPPEYDLRLHLMWEKHLFQEDGIFQLALFSNRRGPMADPWDVTRTFEIPARNMHDLVVGLRLVGVHLTVAVRNLTGDRVRMTSGALSPGQELDLRLAWNFQY